MRNHSLIIRVDIVQYTASAEGVAQSAEQGGRAADIAAQKDEQAYEQQRTVQERLQRERRVERQAAVEEQVQRMIGTVLALATEKHAAVEVRHPVEGTAIRQAAAVERSH